MRQSGKSVNVVLLGNRAEDVRLLSMFNSDSDADVPDCTEIEIGAVGKYFRAPLKEVGFLPLNDYLKNSGWYDKIVAARFAPWSKQGVIFGVPHDLHPTTISYRKDLYDEAGVDLESAKTWREFQEKCLAFESYWRQRGVRRHAVGLAITGARPPGRDVDAATHQPAR